MHWRKSWRRRRSRRPPNVEHSRSECLSARAASGWRCAKNRLAARVEPHSRSECSTLRRFAEAIADAADGFDVIAGGAELAAKRFDMHVDGAFQHQGAFLDGGIHELRARE